VVWLSRGGRETGAVSASEGLQFKRDKATGIDQDAEPWDRLAVFR